MRRPLAAVTLVAALAAAGAWVWTTADRDREWHRLIAAREAALTAGQMLPAIEAFSGAIALRGDSMLGYLKRGETYRRHGDLTAAVRDLRRAAQLDPTATRALEQLGDAYYAQQWYAHAADRYAAYVRIDDRSPRVLYKLGLSRYREGTPASAIAPLRQAVHLNDQFAEAYYVLGLSLRADRQTSDAVWALQRAVQAAPALVAPREALASIFEALNRHGERIEQLEALVALEPEHTGRRIALASAYLERGRADLAVLTLGRAAERHPEQGAIYGALAGVWLEVAESRGDQAAVAKAREAVRAAMARPDRDEAATRVLEGRVLLAAGQPEGALRALREATSRLPVDPVAFERLATAAERVGELREAREALVRYAALTSGDRLQAHIASRIAGLSRRLREPATAADWLARAVRLSPRSEDLVVRLADAQAAAGARDEARRTVARALSDGFDSPALRQLEARLRFE